MQRALRPSSLASGCGVLLAACNLVNSVDGYDAEPPLAAGGDSSSSGAGANGGAGGGGGACGTPNAFCAPLPAPEGAVITVGPSDDLAAALAGAQPGETVMLRSGTYAVAAPGLVVASPSVTVRSESGCRGDVVLDGAYATPDVLTITASEVTLAEVTLTRGLSSIVRIRAGSADLSGVRLHGVHLVDPGDRGVRIEPDDTVSHFVDGGIIECSRVEVTEAGRAHLQEASPDCVTVGIEAKSARGWAFRDNELEGFWCQSGLGGPALRVAHGSRDTIVERNVVVDCGTGIALGFKECPFAANEASCGTAPDDALWRTHDAAACPPPSTVGPCCGQTALSHCGGVVRNNFVFAGGGIVNSDLKVDTGISVEQTHGAHVVHNTVMTGGVGITFHSIEWRWSGTSVSVANNIAGYDLGARDGAEATLQSNLEDASYALFSDDISGGDLHLRAGPQATADVVDQGVALPRGVAPEDIDGETRDAAPDLGADELLR